MLREYIILIVQTSRVFAETVTYMDANIQQRAIHYCTILCSNILLATSLKMVLATSMKMEIIQLCSHYTAQYQLEVTSRYMPSSYSKCCTSVVWQWHSDVHTLYLHTQLAGNAQYL